VSIEALLSRGDGSDEVIDLAAEHLREIRDDELVWIDVVAPDEDEVETLRRALALDDDLASALTSEISRPEATVRDGAVEVVILAPPEDGEAPAPIQVLVGAGWVVTRHAERLPLLDDRRERIQDQREIGLLSPVQFLISVLDWHIDSYFDAAESLDRAVDELDDAALRTEVDLLGRMVDVRRRIARVRRLLGLHREVFAELARPDFFASLDEAEERALAQVTDRLDRAGQAISHAREMLIGTFDVHMTRTAQRTNDIMRVLTLVSVILLPAAALAGIMGMNFKVGLFDDPNLFWVVVGVMVGIGAGTLVLARWRGWL